MCAPHAYAVAVVGDPAILSADELVAWLDYLVNRHTSGRRIVLLSPGGSPAKAWADSRGHVTHPVPECGNQVKQDCEFVAWADAVVILGDPGPWRRLKKLCEEAGVPVRVIAKRPGKPPASTPAWELPKG